MQGIHKTRETLHAKILRLRSIEGIVTSLRFERLWDDSSKGQREEVVEYIKKESKAKIQDWMRTHHSLELGELSTTRLKELARKMRVPNYSRKTKLELIRSIKEAEDVSKQG